MNPSKFQILRAFIELRFTRKFRSNQPSKSIKNRWKQNLLKSPYYAALLQADKAFPIMNKALFMENFDTINTIGINKQEAFELAQKSEYSRDFSTDIKGVSIGLSSGTSGNKGIFITNPQEKAIWVGAVLDRVIGFSLKKRKVAFFLRANNNLYTAVKSKLLEFSFFDLMEPMAAHIAKLYNYEADILVAQPSVLMAIANGYANGKLVPTFKKIISVAEVLEADQKTYIEKVLHCRVDQVYQCTEGFLAYTCKAGNLHFNEDWLHIEKKYIDKNQKRFHPIISDYRRQSQPIVHYELNDIIHEGKPCTCGSKATVIDKIEGRSDDVFHFEDETGALASIYPDFIRRAIIMSHSAIFNYEVRRIGKKRLILSVLAPNNYDFFDVYQCSKKALLELFLSFGIKDIEIEQQDLKPDYAHKFRRIRNDYNPNL